MTTRFVRDFASRAWRGPPTVFRSPFSRPFARTSEVFSGLLELGRRLRSSETAPLFRFYSSGELIRDHVRHTARPDDGTHEGYLDRLRRSLRGREFGIAVNNFQSLQPSLFARSADLLSDLYEELGLPAGGASLELFAGTYRNSPFGVHKDERDNITFVLSGRKTILLWPFEVLREAIGAPAKSRTRTFVPADLFDFRAYRARAVVLEGGPGDVLSWSREWWHVAESRGAPVTTLVLSLARTADPLEHVTKASLELLQQGSGRSRPFPLRGGAWSSRRLESEMSTARRALLDRRLWSSVARRLLAFETSAGFQVIPDLPAAPRDALQDGEILRSTRRGALAWFRNDATTVSLGARGRVLSIPAHPRLLALFRLLARGGAVRVGDALDEYSGEVKTSDAVFQIAREDLRDLLLRLTVCGALVVVERRLPNRNRRTNKRTQVETATAPSGRQPNRGGKS